MVASGGVMRRRSDDLENRERGIGMGRRGGLW